MWDHIFDVAWNWLTANGIGQNITASAIMSVLVVPKAAREWRQHKKRIDKLIGVGESQLHLEKARHDVALKTHGLVADLHSLHLGKI